VQSNQSNIAVKKKKPLPVPSRRAKSSPVPMKQRVNQKPTAPKQVSNDGRERNRKEVSPEFVANNKSELQDEKMEEIKSSTKTPKEQSTNRDEVEYEEQHTQIQKDEDIVKSESNTPPSSLKETSMSETQECIEERESDTNSSNDIKSDSPPNPFKQIQASQAGGTSPEPNRLKHHSSGSQSNIIQGGDNSGSAPRSNQRHSSVNPWKMRNSDTSPGNPFKLGKKLPGEGPNIENDFESPTSSLGSTR